MISTQYKTIREKASFTFKEKSSEFIAEAFPFKDEDDYINILSETKKKYYDASHHCYAVKYGDFIKYSDDGEPSGTAGIRILNAIEHFELNNIMIIVTRYFGGTKLGVGPLGKAYYTAAEEVLRISETITMKAYLKIFIEGSFSHISQVHRILSLFKAKISGTDYSDIIKFTCYLRAEDKEKLKEQLTEASAGSIIVKDSGETLFLEST